MNRAMTYRSFAVLLLVGGICCGSLPAEETANGGVQGRQEATVEGTVLVSRQPLSAVTVYAYDMASAALMTVVTDRHGRFLFTALPAGLYKLVAYKDGFVPAVELLLRRTRDESQYVELRLAPRDGGDVREAQQYWDARQRIPVDVLRQILSVRSEPREVRSVTVESGALLETKMAALGGVEQVGDLGEAQRTGAEFGLRGALGQTKVDIDGRYEQLIPTTGGSMPSGEAHALALQLEREHDSKLSLLTSSSQISGGKDDELRPVGMDLYQLRWSGATGDNGRTAISARYTQQTNFHEKGWIDPAELTGSSETLSVEGSYNRSVSERTSVRTGLSYRQRVADRSDGTLDDEAVGLFTLADSQIQSGVLVEYGLYSSLRGGELSLMPHGGVVVHLGSDWKARTAFSHRLETDTADDLPSRFSSAFYDDGTSCQQVGEACYEVTLSRGDEESDSFSVGAIHREFAETLQLYFSDDFFDRLESLFVVRGDELPELRFSMVRRISPRILAKLESNIAAGGGGIFYATDNLPYENQVRYLVTSIDTRFQRTSTGVFIAFHHLEQDLNPLSQAALDSQPQGLEVQRIQLMLTQDLNALVDMAANLALRFNMELSRGATPFTLTASDEMNKKLTGGISVRF